MNRKIGASPGVIAVYSPKGGVGKTSISVDLAWRCAVQGGHRTLLWDLDFQGGSGFVLDVGANAFVEDPRLFTKAVKLRQLITLTAYDNLFYLGTSGNLRDLSFNLMRLGPKKLIPILAQDLSRTFDRIILDCPPVRNELSDQIFEAAKLMIVPLPVSPLAARALDDVRHDLARCGRSKLPFLPVFSMYDSRRKAHREARNGWMAQFPVIPAASPIEQSAFRRAPVGTFAACSTASQAQEQLWRGIERKLGET
jgi:cellulose biosynthesis protein BcsQ